MSEPILGKDGFQLPVPFPYKNNGGDICCVICCLQHGKVFYQAPCHFKIFRERGAVINEEREEWVTKVFGYNNLKGGRLCDKHYREMLKMKNGKVGGGRKKKGEAVDDIGNRSNPLFVCLVKQLEDLVEEHEGSSPEFKRKREVKEEEEEEITLMKKVPLKQ